MLQNRVTPYGDIIKTSARGAWIGNRGQLHGNTKTILRPFKLKAWITCLLQFKGRHREVMSPGLWTELFFLDEATALQPATGLVLNAAAMMPNGLKPPGLKAIPHMGLILKRLSAKLMKLPTRIG